MEADPPARTVRRDAIIVNPLVSGAEAMEIYSRPFIQISQRHKTVRERLSHGFGPRRANDTFRSVFQANKGWINYGLCRA
jgi:hypothetical protein